MPFTSQFVRRVGGTFVSVLAFGLVPLMGEPVSPGLNEPRTETGVLDMLPGVAEPAEFAELAPSIEGVLTTLAVSEGQPVRRGQVLASLDNRVAAASVQLASLAAARTAAIDRAQEELKAAVRTLERMEQAAAHDAVSEQEVDLARIGVKSAEANLALAEEMRAAAAAQLALEQAKLRLHDVVAPFDGVVVQISANLGESLTRDDPVVTIANFDRLRAHLYVPVAHYQRLTVGADYQAAASAPVAERLSLRLINFEPVIDPATQAFRCVFEIDNREAALPAGFSLRLIRPQSP